MKENRYVKNRIEKKVLRNQSNLFDLPYYFWHSVSIEVGVVFVMEGRPCQYHGQLAAVVGVVVPQRVVRVPSVEPGFSKSS